MKKILLITTGGTVASRETAHGLRPVLDGEKLRAATGAAEGAIDICDLLSLDSSNIAPVHWQMIARAIAVQRAYYDGFIVTHGTDTMAYTSAALYYMLDGIDRPVVLTGSQRPFEAQDTDAGANLHLAYRVAVSGRRGVFLAFGGRIIRGNAAKKLYTAEDDAFRSIGAVEIDLGADASETQHAEVETFRLHDALDERVAVIKLYPGMSPGVIRAHIGVGYRGLIIEGFGSGGVPGADAADNILPALAYARDAACTVVLTTQCVYDGADLSRYEVGRRAAECGAISGGTLPVEALYPLLMLRLVGTPAGETVTHLF